MALRYSTTYIVKVGDNLGSASYWNTRFQDIDLRLNSVEGFTNVANEASQQIINAGISRINDTINPAVSSALVEVTTLTASILSVNAELQSLVVQANEQVAYLENLVIVDGGQF